MDLQTWHWAKRTLQTALVVLASNASCRFAARTESRTKRSGTFAATCSWRNSWFEPWERAAGNSVNAEERTSSTRRESTKKVKLVTTWRRKTVRLRHLTKWRAWRHFRGAGTSLGWNSWHLISIDIHWYPLGYEHSNLGGRSAILKRHARKLF